MESDLVNLILFGSLIVLILLFKLKNKRRNFPPGPKGFPIVGNVHLTKNYVKDIHEVYTKLAKEHGSVFYFKAGFGHFFDTLVLNDIDSVEEAFVKNQNDFSGRSLSWSFAIHGMHGTDIVSADYGPEFKNRKNLASKGFRQFLLGKTLDEKVNNVMSQYLPHFEEYAAKDKPFDPSDDVTSILLNIISGTLFSKQYEMGDQEFKGLVEMNHEFNRTFSVPTEEFLPKFVTKYWQSAGGKRFIALCDELFDYYRKNIREHQEKFDPKCPPQDIVDSLLLIQHENQLSETGEEIKKLDDDELMQVVNNIFVAGSENSMVTLLWMILYLAFYQDIQEKAYQEIKDVIGTENDVHTKDQSRMPFCKAFQMESLRLGMASPLGVPHKTICDTKLCGYDIPKNTSVIVNHYALHQDPNEWENPEEFKPERFLEADGSIKPKPRSWLPFSAGRRACPGENVVRAEIFIVWVSILQRFKILLPDGETPSFDQRFVPTAPYPFKILLKIRD